MKKSKASKTSEAIKSITSERKRTNILRKSEHYAIAFLVQRIPRWISSNMLTGIGFFGNILVGLSLVLASYFDRTYLLLGVLGFFVSWFGDSLDGRIAYYRKIPRKWYGFTLDICIDWLGLIFVGLGFMIYLGDTWYFLGYTFIVLWGWEMIIAILRYKLNNTYSIDAGLLGPTEVRIIIMIILVLEIFIPGLLMYFAIVANLILLVINIIEFNKLLDIANEKDRLEKLNKQ